MRARSEALSLALLAFLCGRVLNFQEPDFAIPERNVTVIRGRDAELPCVVNHLGKHHVAWVKVDTQTILSIHENLITRNYRINLKPSDHRYWSLHIDNVEESDRGFYMCQINTQPMKSQLIYLDVQVSPNILDNETSSDIVVNEGVNVTLTCRASGYPTPTISWKREDGEDISLSGNRKVRHYDGEDFIITRVNRLHMGAYLCIASNQVPPTVSKRIVLHVHFNPMIWVPNQRIGKIAGSDVTLECNTEAFPNSINYWTNEKGDMVSSGEKYTTIHVETNYKVEMKLKIHNLRTEDFGLYKCFAKNSLGKTDGTIWLYEIPRPTPHYITTTDRLNLESIGHMGETVRRGYKDVNVISQDVDKFNIEDTFDSTNDPILIDDRETQQRPQADTVNDSGIHHRSTFVILSILLITLGALV